MRSLSVLACLLLLHDAASTSHFCTPNYFNCSGLDPSPRPKVCTTPCQCPPGSGYCGCQGSPEDSKPCACNCIPTSINEACKCQITGENAPGCTSTPGPNQCTCPKPWVKPVKPAPPLPVQPSPTCPPAPPSCWSCCEDPTNPYPGYNPKNATNAGCVPTPRRGPPPSTEPSKPTPGCPFPAGCGVHKNMCDKGCDKANCSKPRPPPPPPPPPLSTNPCIRFGHTIPVGNHVDVQINQDGDPSITHTWSNYGFAAFSDWVNVFKPGTGTITVWENTGGTRGAQLYQLKGIPLTPGPLMVVIKVASSVVSQPSKYWPPALPDAIETISASYVESSRGSKVRLFNLSPDTKAAGMTCSANGTAEIATGVRYSLGSSWAPVPTQAETFGFTDDSTGKVVTSRQLTPAVAPIGNTAMMLGLQTGSGAFGVQAVSLVDAPEGGVCAPSSSENYKDALIAWGKDKKRNIVADAGGALYEGAGGVL